MTQIALPRGVSLSDDERLSVWTADHRHVIEIGAKYRRAPATAFCFVSCGECYPGSNARCWQRRTELTFVYRVRELLHTDYVHGLGRYFLVSLVRPDVWQVRAFAPGGAASRVARPGWHKLTGIVTEAQIGERVE